MTNSLKHLKEFQQLLKNYQISKTGKQTLKQTKIIFLVSPSGVGRNTVINKLIKTGGFHFLVSDTTRKPRVNNGVLEKDGVEYWFKSESQFLDGLKKGNYLEAAIIHGQQVSGISISELKKAKQNQLTAVADIEIIGIDNIIKAFPDVKAVFMLPPSFDEWMKRLDNRGGIALAEKKRRLESAVQELNHALQNDYYEFVVNEELDDTTKQIKKIINGEINAEEQIGCRELAGELLYKTKQWLHNN